MKKTMLLLGETVQYELIKTNESAITKRTVRYQDKDLGTIVCRGMQRNGYEVEGREDIAIGHSMSSLAQYLVLEQTIRNLIEKLQSILEGQKNNDNN